MSDSVARIVDGLRQPTDTHVELQSLQRLRCQLRAGSVTTPKEELATEDVVPPSSGPKTNPFIATSITAVFATDDASSLHAFVRYVFCRRFGWSESDVTHCRTPAVTQRHGRANFKAVVNELLDEYLLWFSYQPMSDSMLEALMKTVSYTHNKPVVRNQAVIHLMDWLSSNFSGPTSTNFQMVMEAVLLGMTDIWSAVRNSCCSRLSCFIEHMTISQLEQFFVRLQQICECSAASWQAKEGAIMGIHCVIRRFQWISVLPDDHNEDDLFSLSTSSQTQYFLKFNQQQLSAIPEFISSRIHALTFALLASPQLSIRETAIRAYSAYMSKCHFKEALASFKDVMCQLRRGTEPPTDSSGDKLLPHLAVLNPDYKFMDAYEADGLLGVCVHLIKQISPGFLLPSWPIYFSTFSLYLMHPASTVRQTTSTIFKFLVAKDSSNPLLLKLVLQSLSATWDPRRRSEVDGEVTTSNDPVLADLANPAAGNEPAAAASTDNDEGKLREKWEWREGRLLAYELLLQFLVKNHWVYTFGASRLASLSSHADCRDGPVLPPSDNATNNTSKWSEGAEAVGGGLTPNELSVTPRHGGRHHSSGQVPESSERKSDRLVAPRYSICSTNPAMETSLHDHRQLTLSYSGGMTGEVTGGRLCRADTTAVRQTASDVTRMTTMAGYDSLSLRTLVRHYTYYISGSAPLDTVCGVNRTASLLKHVHNLDAQLLREKEKEGSDGNGTHPVSANDLKSFFSTAETFDALELDRKDADGGAPEWQNKMELETFCALLERIFYQTAESLADARWEVRRMGQQLLPVLIEVMRWYDVTILKELLFRHLTATPSVHCYAACLALQSSLEHVVRLHAMVERPPTTWQDPETCSEVIGRMTRCLCGQLSEWSVTVQRLLLRPQCDKLTAVALRTLMLICSHLHSKLDCSRYYDSVVDVIKRIFSVAHSDVADAGAIYCPRDTPQRVIFTELFLSCSSKPETTVQGKMKQVEAHVLSEIQSVLSRFVATCPLEAATSLLPVLCYYIGCYGNDDTLNKQLCDSIYAVIARLDSGKPNDQSDGDSSQWLLLALRQLADIVMETEAKASASRQALELYAEICPHVCAKHHMTHILQTIARRLDESSDSETLKISLTSTPSGSETDLAIRSNDIPASPRQHEYETSSDEDDPSFDSSHDALLAECQTLNLSANSGSVTSGRFGVTSGAPSGGSGESDSDWDSWTDDVDEDHDAFLAVVTEFLQKMEWRLSIEMGGTAALEDHLKQLSAKERKLLEKVLCKNDPEEIRFAK